MCRQTSVVAANYLFIDVKLATHAPAKKKHYKISHITCPARKIHPLVLRIKHLNEFLFVLLTNVKYNEILIIFFTTVIISFLETILVLCGFDISLFNVSKTRVLL